MLALNSKGQWFEPKHRRFFMEMQRETGDMGNSANTDLICQAMWNTKKHANYQADLSKKNEDNVN